MTGGREVEGVVEDALPHGLYRIICDNGNTVTASLGGQSRQTIVRVIPGDRVIVEISSLDPSRGKIKRRLS